MVECTALEMRHTRKGIVGSNPTFSAISRSRELRSRYEAYVRRSLGVGGLSQVYNSEAFLRLVSTLNAK